MNSYWLWSLEPPSSTKGGDRHMCLQTFLYKIQFRTTFIWTFFRCDAYFWQRSALKWMYFPFWVQVQTYTLHPISFEPKLLKSIRVAPSSQNLGYSFFNHSPRYIPNLKSIGSYAGLYQDPLSVYFECFFHNLKWKKTMSNVSRKNFVLSLVLPWQKCLKWWKPFILSLLCCMQLLNLGTVNLGKERII